MPDTILDEFQRAVAAHMADGERPPADHEWPWRGELLNWRDRNETLVPPDEVAAIVAIEKLIGLNGRTVLDYGCGRGVCLREAAERGARHLIAIDIDPWALLLTSRVLWPRLVRLVPVERLVPANLPPRCADLVWSHGVVEHMTRAEIRMYFADAIRLSSKWVAFSAPNPENVAYQAFRKYHEAHGSWIWGYEEPLGREYGEILQDLGCEVVVNGTSGNTRQLVRMYTDVLRDPESEAQVMESWVRGSQDGISTVVVARVPGSG